jgi:GMP synthase-like glutamine amidotransferase
MTEPDDDRISVGLLLCDHLDPEPAAVAGDYPELYPAAFGAHGLDIRVYEATQGELPTDLDECDAWMVSGSRHSAYDDDAWISELSELIATIVTQKRPLAGICFGHQLAALALGGEVTRADAGWGVGGRTFDVVNRAPWMGPRNAVLSATNADDNAGRSDPGADHRPDRSAHGAGHDDNRADGASSAPDQFTILMSHRDQVTSLPVGAELIATADYCPVGAYRLGRKLFCVQGHPEFVPGLSATLMELRRDRIGSDVVDAGLASLEPPSPPLDQDLVAGWIAEFYRQALDR